MISLFIMFFNELKESFFTIHYKGFGIKEKIFLGNFDLFQLIFQ